LHLGLVILGLVASRINRVQDWSVLGSVVLGMVAFGMVVLGLVVLGLVQVPSPSSHGSRLATVSRSPSSYWSRLAAVGSPSLPMGHI
jgi:phage-related minor tail protein